MKRRTRLHFVSVIAIALASIASAISVQQPQLPPVWSQVFSARSGTIDGVTYDSAQVKLISDTTGKQEISLGVGGSVIMQDRGYGIYTVELTFRGLDPSLAVGAWLHNDQPKPSYVEITGEILRTGADPNNVKPVHPIVFALDNSVANDDNQPLPDFKDWQIRLTYRKNYAYVLISGYRKGSLLDAAHVESHTPNLPGATLRIALFRLPGTSPVYDAGGYVVVRSVTYSP